MDSPEPEGTKEPKTHDVGDWCFMGILVPLVNYLSGDLIRYGGATFHPVSGSNKLQYHQVKNGATTVFQGEIWCDGQMFFHS